MITIDKYILQAQDILSLYKYPEPFHLFIKDYFRKNKKFGSRDRKTLKHILYSNFRLPYQEVDWNEKIALTSQAQEQMYSIVNTKIVYHPAIAEGIKKKLASMPSIFETLPLSGNMSEVDYLTKTLVAPYTFIRSHVKKLSLLQILADENIETVSLEGNAIALAGSNVDLEAANIPFRQYAVQDYSSQKVCELFTPKPDEVWWDCCAASGGKSIALLQKNEAIHLYVSDVRSSILHNLRRRFATYSFKAKEIFVHDALLPLTQSLKFDGIICDVPCSGSGTWARTPEQLYFHSEQQVITLQELQLKIAQNALNHLHRYGTMYYITCSVFKKENEDVIEQLLSKNPKIKLIQQQLMDGREVNSDFLFVAVLRRED